MLKGNCSINLFLYNKNIRKLCPESNIVLNSYNYVSFYKKIRITYSYCK